MRVALCLALLVTAATPALAQDRYGPEPSAMRTAANTNMPGQRLLTWSNKVDPMAAAPQAPAQPQMQPAPPVPMPQAAPQAENAPWRRLTGAAQPAQAAAQPVRQATPAPQTMPAPAPRPVAAAQPAQPAPQAMASYTPPARPTTPVSPSRPIAPVSATPAAPSSGAPARIPLAGAAPTTPAPAAAPATPDYRTDATARATPAPQGEQARYYSLHRDYGETPDPIATPQPTQVFLAAVPLSSLDQLDNQDADTGKTAAENKARLNADWGAASDPSMTTSKRVTITRP